MSKKKSVGNKKSTTRAGATPAPTQGAAASERGSSDRRLGDEADVLKWAKSGDLKRLRFKLGRAKDLVASRDEDGNTALLCAAAEGHVDTVNYLLHSAPKQATVVEANNAGNTALLRAAHKNKQQMVRWLIKRGGACVAQTNKLGQTALLRAAANGCWGTVGVLLNDCGASITETDRLGNTALLTAAAHGRSDMVRNLLGSSKWGASTAEVNNKGETALLCAAFNGHRDTVQWLLEKGGCAVTEADNDGATALLLAADQGHQTVMEWLLDKGKATIDQTDNSGNTALLRAAYHGRRDVVEWLLSEGKASVAEQNSRQDTCLLVAAKRGHLDVVKWLLLQHNAPHTDRSEFGASALLCAASCGKLRTVKWLVEERFAHVTQRDRDGNTALLIASKHGKLNTMRWLLDSGGASIAEVNQQGNTPLLCAARNGQLPTVQWLLNSGWATVTEANPDGEVALLAAARRGHLHVVHWLLAKTIASLEQADRDGNTVLLCAARAGQLGTVQWLLSPEGGASVDETNGHGDTSLMLAAANNRLTLVQWLVDEGGASATDANMDDDTPLILAAAQGHVEVVQWLVEHAKYVATQINRGSNTPLLVAAANKQLGVVQWLLDHTNARISQVNSNGNTALHLALLVGHGDTVKSLVARRASLTWQDDQGNTALLLAAAHADVGVVRCLFDTARPSDIADSMAIANANGDTVLLAAARRGSLETVRWLLNSYHCSVDEKGFREACAARPELASWVQLETARLRTAYAKAKLLRFGEAQVKRIKLVVCGAAGSGKTSIAKRIKGGVFALLARMFTLAGSRRTAVGDDERPPSEYTVGIDMTQVNIDRNHTFVIHDLAGQPQYYVTHELFLTDSSAVFMIVVSLKASTEERIKQLDFWTRYLSSQFAYAANPDASSNASVPPAPAARKPPVVQLVFSHADLARGKENGTERTRFSGKWRCPWAEDQRSRLQQVFDGRLRIAAHVHVLDSAQCNPAGMSALRKDLIRFHDEAATTRVPKIVEVVLSKLDALRADHAEWPIVDQKEVCAWLKTIREELANPDLFHPTLTYLDSIGEFVWLKQSKQVALKPQFLHRRVIGRLFAPASFSVSVSKSDGKVTKDKLSKLYQSTEETQLVLDTVVGLGIGVPMATTENEECTTVLLPSALNTPMPTSAWQLPAGTVTVQGRRILCKDNDALTTGFFPRMMVHVCNRETAGSVTLWKNGFWYADQTTGARIVVQQSDLRHAVDVWVWAEKRTACAYAVANTMALVTSMQAKLCPGIAVRHLAVSVDTLRTWQFGSPPDQVPAYDIDAVRSKDPDAFLGPVHPSTAGIVEKPSHLLIEADTAALHPSVCPPDLAEDYKANITPQRPLRVLVVRANSRHKELVMTHERTSGRLVGAATLSLDSDAEERLIKKALEQSTACCWHVVLESIGDVTKTSLQDKIATFEPDWIHYIGHCSEQGLVLNDCTLAPHEFAALLRLRPVAGVVLNCCKARPWVVDAIAPYVTNVIAGCKPLPDAWAPTFAHGLWRHIFNGYSIDDSLEAAGPTAPPPKTGGSPFVHRRTSWGSSAAVAHQRDESLADLPGSSEA